MYERKIRNKKKQQRYREKKNKTKKNSKKKYRTEIIGYVCVYVLANGALKSCKLKCKQLKRLFSLSLSLSPPLSFLSLLFSVTLLVFWIKLKSDRDKH